MVELELRERVKRLEKQQVLLIGEINAAVQKIMKACEKALPPKPDQPIKKKSPARTPEQIDESYEPARKKANRPPKDTLD